MYDSDRLTINLYVKFVKFGVTASHITCNKPNVHMATVDSKTAANFHPASPLVEFSPLIG